MEKNAIFLCLTVAHWHHLFVWIYTPFVYKLAAVQEVYWNYHRLYVVLEKIRI